MARIMVVEDEAVVAADIRGILEALGHEVVATLGTGAEAIAAAARTPPELVLMDVRLRDGVDGIWAAAQIRGRADVPVVFLTAYGDDDTVRRACSTDPYGYVVKPFAEEDLRGAVDVALQRHAELRRATQRDADCTAVLDALALAVVVADDDGAVRFANRAARAALGLAAGDLIGRRLDEVVVLEAGGAPLAPADLIGAATEEAPERAARLLRRAGALDVHVAVSRLAGTRAGLVVALRAG